MNTQEIIDHCIVDPPGKVIFRWRPEEPDEEKRMMEDIADEYVVIEREAAVGGIIVYARYRGEWIANPWNLRHLLRRVLRQTRIEEIRDLAAHPLLVLKTDNFSQADLARLKAEMAKVCLQPASVATIEVVSPPVVIVLGLDDSVESLSEADMAQHGWVRQPPKIKIQGVPILGMEGLDGFSFNGASPDVETIARDLHEAGREAVLKGATVGHSVLGEPARGFREWDEITEEAREGRRIQARWLLERYSLARRPE